ncbi:MAG TPA: S-layer homology domain-containing protein, partial [Candidatus Monoglobus merdigallinarum]|nr:S-layer homology domain-containing protein [Candidatus Monoglobus merdigallinarum]
SVPAFSESLDSASSYSIGSTQSGSITETNPESAYRFTLNSSGRITVQYNAENMSYSRLKLYDSTGQEIWSDLPYWDSNSKQISFNEDIELTDGTYYFMVAESSGYGSYSFTLSNASPSTVSDNSNNNNEFETSTQPPTSTPRPTNTPRPASSDDNETSFGSSVSDWAKEEVETAYDNNLIPETIIGDDLTQNIDRAEFAAIAVQLYEELTGSYVYTGGTPFTDIARNDNYVSICKAYDLNITNGVTASTFDPHANITREDLATMLCRTIKKYSDPNWSLENDSEYYLDTSGVKKFADDDDISDYAKPSVYYMAKYGIVKGVDDTHFAPKNTNAWQEAIGYATATREQAILMSLRIYNASDIWG